MSESPSPVVVQRWAMRLEPGTEVEFGTGVYTVLEAGEVQDGQWPVKVRSCIPEESMPAPTPSVNNNALERSWWAANPGDSEYATLAIEPAVQEEPAIGREAIIREADGCAEYWLPFSTDEPLAEVHRNPEPYNAAVASWVLS